MLTADESSLLCQLWKIGHIITLPNSALHVALGQNTLMFCFQC